MATIDHPVEHTTQLALHEKAKLKKSLGRFDMVLFTLCALVGLDTLGLVASNGPEGFLWLVVLAVVFVFPYMLVMSEVGAAFTQEGGPYEWVKMAFGRFWASINTFLYWFTNPLWVGGSLAFIATEAWNTAALGDVVSGSVWDYLFKFAFIWFSITVAIVSLSRGKWIPNAGAIARFVVLGFFTLTTVIYAIEHGVEGFAVGDMSPTRAIFIALVPIVLFNYVGFELQSGAAEEMQNPQKDVPLSVLRSGSMGVALYIIPVFAILMVLPADKISGIGGFIDAVNETFSVYGGAQTFLFTLTALGFILTLMTSGAVWMIGSDRTQAVAAFDGGFFPYFGVFSRALGTPVRVNVLSGVASTIFTIIAINMLKSESSADAFTVVLTIAISTTLISYLLIFPAAIKLRYSHANVHRPYRVPGGNAGMWICAGVCTFWVLLGSWTSVFPGTVESLIGVDYDFLDAWGVSRAKFETLTLGTLAVVIIVGIIGYFAGSRVRESEVLVPLEEETQPAPG